MLGALIGVILVVGCDGGPELLPVTLPDLSRMDAPVQEQIRQRYTALTQLLEARAAPSDLGAAFGGFGMLLHAAEQYDAAEPAYRNAQALMPGEPRWPYFLAHLDRVRGNTSRSIESFKRVLELRPDNLPALVWLARAYLDQGRPELAEPLLDAAQSIAPETVAVLAARGQAALARRDYARAVSMLEEALRIDPAAQSVHAPLALAYRGLGDASRAEAHLKRWRNTEILVPDPWRLELDLSLESGLSYELRGVRALDQKDFATAAEMFRKGLALAPPTSMLGRSLRHKLGTALFLSGHVREAVAQFEDVVRLAPESGFDEPSAKAHYSLGVIAASSGRLDEGIGHFRAAVAYNPSYVEAHVGLGNVLRRAGRWESSLAPYAEALRLNPRAAEARLGYALALVRLRRYVDARVWLEEAVRRQPDRPELAQALARVLAASPDPRARDGQRALAIVRDLFTSDQTTTLGETMAMALAEVGDFATAAGVQRGIIKAAARAGQHDAVRRMRANLARYERGQPCRTPWADEDPVSLQDSRF